MAHLTIAQISDAHVLPDPRGKLRELEPLPRLERIVARVVQRIRDRGDVDLVVFTGDQIQDDPEAYPVFLEAIASLEVPVAFVPGNHDHREGFARFLLTREEGAIRSNPAGPADPTGDLPLHRALRLGPARILLLDSLWDGEVQGRLGRKQLDWLTETLRRKVPGPTLAFVHHPPIPTGVDWLDPHVIEDGEELVRILAGQNVRHLFFGHVHQPMTLERNGLVAVGAPATSFGFGGDGEAPVLLGGPPGLTWIDIAGDHVRSRVEWLDS